MRLDYYNILVNMLDGEIGEQSAERVPGKDGTAVLGKAGLQVRAAILRAAEFRQLCRSLIRAGGQ